MTDPWPLRSSLELGALSTGVPCACLHVKHVLWEWGLNSLAESAVLLVSELERRRRERRCRRRALGGGPQHPLELVPHRGTPGQGHLVRAGRRPFRPADPAPANAAQATQPQPTQQPPLPRRVPRARLKPQAEIVTDLDVLRRLRDHLMS